MTVLVAAFQVIFWSEKGWRGGYSANRPREYLQAFVLRSFHDSGAFRRLAFVGGTALRFLHGLRLVFRQIRPAK